VIQVKAPPEIRSRNTFARMALRFSLSLLILIALPGLVRAYCIDYTDYVRWVGALDVPGHAREVTIEGEYAYVAGGYLTIVDLSDPSSPSIAGSIGVDAEDVAVADSYAYVAAWDGFSIVDVSNPDSLSIVAHMDDHDLDPQGFISGVTVDGTYCYLTSWYWGLHIIDVSDPAYPQLVGSSYLLGGSRDVVVSGAYAYVASETFGLYILDVSDPDSPHVVGELNTSGSAQDVAVSDAYAYIADGDGGLLVIDVSDPTAPWITGSVQMRGASHIAIDGPYAFVSSYHNERSEFIIDVSEPWAPVVLGRVGGPGMSGAVALRDGHAYVAQIDLHIVDLTPLRFPGTIGHLETSGDVLQVEVSETYAYVIKEDPSSLLVIDITNPASPWMVGSLEVTGDTWRGMQVIANRAYVVGYYAFWVIDISDPASLKIAGSVDLPNWGRAIAVVGELAYIANGEAGLQVIDISDPTSPWIVGSVDTPGQAHDVDVNGMYAYVADSDWIEEHDDLQLIDIADPVSPTIVGSLDTPEYVGALAVGHYAYLSQSSGPPLLLVDVSDPTSPWIVNSFHMKAGFCRMSWGGWQHPGLPAISLLGVALSSSLLMMLVYRLCLASVRAQQGSRRRGLQCKMLLFCLRCQTRLETR
jgi:hypothetical protein